MSDQPLLKTAGELLGEARAAQGLSLEVLAERTKIPVKVLSALELDEYHKISGPLYIKSFLRTYAVDLGLDADKVLDLYTRFGGEKGASSTVDMVWEEEEVQVSRVGLPWPRILMGAGVAVILIGVALFALRGCGDENGQDRTANDGADEGGTTGISNPATVPAEEESAADLRRGSLLAGGKDSLEAEGRDSDQESTQKVERSESPVGLVDNQASDDQRADPVQDTTADPVDDKSDPTPARSDPVVRPVENAPDKAEETSTPPVTVSRQEEPPPREIQPRDTSPGSLPPAVAGNAGTPFAGGQAWPVVMRLVSDLPVRAEVRRDGETEFETAAWSDPVALPMRDIRPGRAYGVREGLVVYWGAGDHFSLRLDRVVGVEVSINGVARDIRSLRPGQEIILDDHSAASGTRR